MDDQILEKEKVLVDNMFCFQCQEASKGIGCSVKGVCGKTDEVSNLQDLLIFVCKGVAILNHIGNKHCTSPLIKWNKKGETV